MTKRATTVVFAVLLLAAPFVAVAGEMPKTEGKAVIDYLQGADYQSWQMWPGKEALYKGQHPHGAFLTTYVNKKAAKTLEKMSGEFPNGAMIVKENYSPEKKLAAITVMYRVEGYDSSAGDWFWLKYQPDGTVQKEGKVAGCINCHKSVKNNDWVFTGPVK
ncbi:MAG: cytochrome P460 family protein [Desulfuromonadales bacterium]|nr:cytochrome P460 family protein [Desulfuromonadales bacterium]NIR33727.1 cytochrome P460 family protein [Desulfuromonadales bacterium]NIS39878.1 cytochrome P460 family protein [Desulfuromonadales bacterium]